MSRARSHAYVFNAVADPTRRAILDRLRQGSAPVTELASGFRVSRPAISKHLKVLRSARLVRERKEGRQRIYQLEPERMKKSRSGQRSTAGSGFTTSAASNVTSNKRRRK